MRPFSATVLLLTALSIGTGAAFAKGGQDNLERQEALQAEFEKARKANQANSGFSLFERLFGSNPKQAHTQTDTSKAKKKTN